MKILKANSISKKFGNVQAVNSLSFEVDESTVFGILGPNGAGKSTTIRMITNILMPDGGEITYLDKPLDSEYQKLIGFLPEERGLYKKLKVIDQLVYFARLKGMTAADARSEGLAWLKRFDARDWEKKKIQELSKGMQQKVQFISTIMHKPKILILDEPFSGFDPVNADFLKTIIRELRNSGTTVFFSTHIMEQAEQMCDYICLINKGQKLLAGNLREVKKQFSKDTIVIEFEGKPDFLDKFSGLSFINKTDTRAEFRIKNPELTPNDILRAAAESVSVYEFSVSEPSLHEIFVDVVSKEGEKSND